MGRRRRGRGCRKQGTRARAWRPGPWLSCAPTPRAPSRPAALLRELALVLGIVGVGVVGVGVARIALDAGPGVAGPGAEMDIPFRVVAVVGQRRCVRRGRRRRHGGGFERRGDGNGSGRGSGDRRRRTMRARKRGDARKRLKARAREKARRAAVSAGALLLSRDETVIIDSLTPPQWEIFPGFRTAEGTRGPRVRKNHATTQISEF